MPEKDYLTVEDAIARMREGVEVHTFMDAPGPGGVTMLIGAMWDREQVIENFRKHQVAVAGPGASGLGHGLVTWDDEGMPVFVETRP